MQRSDRFHRIALIATALVLLTAGCLGSKSAIDPSQVKVEKAPDPSVVEVQHPEQFSLVTVEQRPTAEEMLVNGVIAPDVNKSVPVLSLAGGRVVDIRAKLGDDVKKGQVLLEIDSPDVAAAFSDYQKFRTDEILANRQLERSKLLYSRGAIAQKDLEVAEDAEQKAKVDVQTSVQRLKVLGADVDHPSPVVPVRAPINGTIVEQNTTGGTGVKSLDNSPNLFTIADLSRVWVLCDVYENMLPQVHLGDFAEVRLAAYPDRRLRARVINISRVLDPTTRAAKVRLELNNSERLLRAGMFVTAVFRSKKEKMTPVVPATAVLRLHDKDWVFRPEGGNRFRRSEIRAGTTASDGMRQVLAGLAPGDKVVVNALQFAGATEEQ
jgi:cobalt-zinc-cadmium efflux system membrane fusion protein